MKPALHLPRRLARTTLLAPLPAACLLLVLPPAATAEPDTAVQHAATIQADASASVLPMEPVPQRQPNALTGKASDAISPAQPPALDWNFTPRRTFQGRRR
jgi:hypothetical protein